MYIFYVCFTNCNLFRNFDYGTDNGTCKCGQYDDNITKFTVHDDLWCCKTTNDNCTYEEDEAKLSSVKCIGMALSLSQECHSKTNKPCNYYPNDEHRNGDRNFLPRSHQDICRDNRYSNTVQM